jgi:hypothetical protein
VTLDLAAYPVEPTALFIPLDPAALDELEVTLGPKADDAVLREVEEFWRSTHRRRRWPAARSEFGRRSCLDGLPNSPPQRRSGLAFQGVGVEDAV